MGFMRLLVTGSRDWTDRAPVEAALRWAHENARPSLLIHGACDGLDKLAASVWSELRAEWSPDNPSLAYMVASMPADWKRFGKSAGPIRNAAMIHVHKPHMCIAFPLPASVGTWECIRLCRNVGIETFVWPDGDPWK